MANIIVSDRATSTDFTYGQIQLSPVEWNDWWEYKNMYTVTYTSNTGNTHRLGHVKIQNPNDPPSDDPKHPLKVGFSASQLPEGLISLGQADEYYTRLSDLPDHERSEYCIALRDAVWEPQPLKLNRSKTAVRKSLLRSVPYSSVLGEYHRALRKLGEANYYRLEYTRGDFNLTFVVDPTTKPRTNLHAVIGRNGVGKTTLLRHITELLATGKSDDTSEQLLIFDEDGHSEGILAGVQYVSWSAFDSFFEAKNWNIESGISYSEIGIDGILQSGPEKGLEKPKVIEMPGLSESPNIAISGFLESLDREDSEKPVDSFARAFLLVIMRGRSKLWLEALDTLESDPVFRRLPILDDLRRCVEDALEDGTNQITYQSLSQAFSTLSDGHKVVLLTVTYIAATLAEQTLVVLDEPEAHLHPPLLSSLIRCLNELLIKKNAMAIVATHSPVVLQEVPRNCVWKLQRNSKGLHAKRPEIETFGEDVGALTHEVFGLEVEASGFYKTLSELASRFDNFDEAVNELDGHLGLTGRSVLRSLIATEHPNINGGGY